MKKILRSILALSLATLLALPLTALGEGIALTLDESGTLTLSGSGTVPSDVLSQLSEEELARVTDVVIEEGITGMDGYALERIGDHLASVTIPASVTTLGPNVLGTKGALAYTIYGDPETLRPLLSASNEDYGYFRTSRSRTLTPGEAWTALGRGIPQAQALGLPDGTCETLAGIELSNGGKTSSASADG